MKKVLKVLSIIVLVISILVVSIILFANLFIIIRILFFGMTVGSNEYPDSIWFGERLLYGFSGLKTYYHVWGELVYMFEIPISIFCILYQIVYFKIIRKKLKPNK